MEDLLAERGITVSYQTTRQWCRKFGIEYTRMLKGSSAVTCTVYEMSPLLPAGTYQVTSELARFKTSVHDKVAVQVNQTTRLDIAMEVSL